MAVQFLIFFIGLAVLVIGADVLVDGASSIARRAGLSEFVIGLTIVGCGTSAPEMVVSFIGAAQGNADISVGNIIGSNIFNVLLILGFTALMRPIAITRENWRKDIPVNFFVSLLVIVFGVFLIGGRTLTRAEGVLFILLFVLYIADAFKNNKENLDDETEEVKSSPLGAAILMAAGGLAGLIFGGQMFVNSAESLARMFGMSDKFIAITILAGGTSMPELVTCIVASVKRKGQLALGNIIGSNIFNILLILGGSAVICPLSFGSMDWIDLGTLLLSSVLIFVSALIGRKERIGRRGGAIMVSCFAIYMAYLIINL